VGAKSADHLEATIDEDIDFLAQSDTVATALPGASLGLGKNLLRQENYWMQELS
jgi:imidazolonepropionase